MGLRQEDSEMIGLIVQGIVVAVGTICCLFA